MRVCSLGNLRLLVAHESTSGLLLSTASPLMPACRQRNGCNLLTTCSRSPSRFGRGWSVRGRTHEQERVNSVFEGRGARDSGSRDSRCA